MKKYKIGYLQGSFDLFHIGHLNIIKKSKELCEYLIVGIVNDEVNKYYKKEYPYIPFKERKQIVEAIKYVDEVVEINFKNYNKLIAWEELLYDLHLSGDDHRGKFSTLKEELKKRGADLVYLPYTKSTSSTKIKKVINKRNNIEIEDEINKKGQLHNFQIAVLNSFVDINCEKIAIYGAGIRGKRLLKTLKEGNQNVIAFVDQNETLKGTYIEDTICKTLDEFDKIKENTVLLVSPANSKEFIEELKQRFPNVIGSDGISLLLNPRSK